VTADSAAPSTEDIRQLARLHRVTMPHSVLGHMGAATLERYYRWVVQSTSEQLFVTRENAEIVGAAVLSLSPDSVMRRFITTSPLSFVMRAAAAFLRDSRFRRDVRGFFLSRDSGNALQMPEVLQIFVAPEQQSRHTGSELLDRVEAWLKANRVSRYCVRTLAERNDATLAFYERRGFQAAGESTFCGESYRVLEKAVA
jgi:ribosomal protein S18 acetylase RimI-like enzyme